MVEKTYKIVFILFAIESVFLIIGIAANKISYGTGLATSITKIGIFFLLFLTTIVRFSMNKLDTNTKKGLGISMIVFMLFLMTYFLIENTFKIEM